MLMLLTTTIDMTPYMQTEREKERYTEKKKTTSAEIDYEF